MGVAAYIYLLLQRAEWALSAAITDVGWFYVPGTDFFLKIGTMLVTLGTATTSFVLLRCEVHVPQSQAFLQL